MSTDDPARRRRDSSTGDPARGRGVAATRVPLRKRLRTPESGHHLHGLSTSRPRRRRDSRSHGMGYVAAAASPRPASHGLSTYPHPTDYPRRGRGSATTLVPTDYPRRGRGGAATLVPADYPRRGVFGRSARRERGTPSWSAASLATASSTFSGVRPASSRVLTKCSRRILGLRQAKLTCGRDRISMSQPALPRPTSTEYPRCSRGVAATRLHGLSTSRRRRDPPPRNIHVAAAAVPRPDSERPCSITFAAAA